MKENQKLFSRDLKPLEKSIKKRVIQAFKEDLGKGDLTTSLVFGKEKITAEAVIISNSDGILAGMLEASTIFKDGKIQELESKKDGDEIHEGDVILKLRGPLQEILSRERTALNYLQRMSGIATFSRKLSKKFPGRVLFLRKCDPGLLYSEKRAVALGGCLTHRIGLFDGILIKENHLKTLGKGAIKEAIARADKSRKTIKKFLPIEIEVTTSGEAVAAAEVLKDVKGPNILMLDNMSPNQVKKCAKRIKEISKDIIIEASGGVTEENIRDYLKSGADFVSTSAFVYHSGFLDMSLMAL